MVFSWFSDPKQTKRKGCSKPKGWAQDAQLYKQAVQDEKDHHATQLQTQVDVLLRGAAKGTAVVWLRQVRLDWGTEP